MGTHGKKMEIKVFTVDETPYACWDWDLESKNLEFLAGIDSDYFRYVAEAHAAHLEGDDRHRAALSLRISYSQALEVLFSLLCATVQAPNCVVGWMISYKNFELSNVVRKITNSQPVHNRFKDGPISWDLLAKHVHSYLEGDTEKINWIQTGFGKLWRRFAGDFLDEKLTQEYNSAKHGLRTRPGGFSLAIGLQETPDQPAPPEKMQSLGGSKYGTSYFAREKIIENDRINIRPRRQARNWNPENLLNGLTLLAMSINNTLSFLQIVNKVERRQYKYLIPIEEDFFRDPWKESVGVINCQFDRIINPEYVRPVTREQILASYSEQDGI